MKLKIKLIQKIQLNTIMLLGFLIAFLVVIYQSCTILTNKYFDKKINFFSYSQSIISSGQRLLSIYRETENIYLKTFLSSDLYKFEEYRNNIKLKMEELNNQIKSFDLFFNIHPIAQSFLKFQKEIEKNLNVAKNYYTENPYQSYVVTKKNLDNELIVTVEFYQTINHFVDKITDDIIIKNERILEDQKQVNGILKFSFILLVILIIFLFSFFHVEKFKTLNIRKKMIHSPLPS